MRRRLTRNKGNVYLTWPKAWKAYPITASVFCRLAHLIDPFFMTVHHLANAGADSILKNLAQEMRHTPDKKGYNMIGGAPDKPSGPHEKKSWSRTALFRIFCNSNEGSVEVCAWGWYCGNLLTARTKTFQSRVVPGNCQHMKECHARRTWPLSNMVVNNRHHHRKKVRRYHCIWTCLFGFLCDGPSRQNNAWFIKGVGVASLFLLWNKAGVATVFTLLFWSHECVRGHCWSFDEC